MSMDEMQIGAGRIPVSNRARRPLGFDEEVNSSSESSGDIVSRLSGVEQRLAKVGKLLDILGSKLNGVLRPSTSSGKGQTGQGIPKAAISHVAERLDNIGYSIDEIADSLDNLVDRADI